MEMQIFTVLARRPWISNNERKNNDPAHVESGRGRFSIAGDVQWVYSKLKGVLGPFLAQMHCRYKQEWTQTSARRKKECKWNGQLSPARPGIVFFFSGLNWYWLFIEDESSLLLLVSILFCLSCKKSSVIERYLPPAANCKGVLPGMTSLRWFQFFGCIAMVVEYLLILGRQKAATRCRWRIELHSYTSIYPKLYQFNIFFITYLYSGQYWTVCVWCLFESILASWSFLASGFEKLAIPHPWFWHLDVCVKAFGCCAWAPRQHGDMVLAAQRSRNDPRSKRRLVIIPYYCLIHTYWIHLYIYIYPFKSLLRIWNGWNMLFYLQSMPSQDHSTT